MPTAFLGRNAVVTHSAFNRGSDLEGTVENSVLSQGVNVAEGAKVSYSVLLPGCTVEDGAEVAYAILGEGCHVGRNCRVGANPEDCDPDNWGLTVLAPGCQLEEGRIVPAKTMLSRDGEEVSK